MSLALGTRLGPYDVTAKIGQGGMGEVYRAHDTKLNRDVALKVLPDSFLHDADRLARFQREAHVLASLNHPNIAAIYGLEEAPSTSSGQAGTRALVMELVEGEDLSQRIARGAIPLDEALPIAKQIAEALEAAHEQGIIHRDLKPANIKVKADGTVKVLDFGLAKSASSAAEAAPYAQGSAAQGSVGRDFSRAELSQSPTITTPAMTQVGMLLGTAAYMSPEQAKGRPADKRSDVWAFGCVLYEMLTGQRAFADDDVSETLAAVLKSEPDWTRVPPDVPQAIRTLIQRCLVKDRRQRVSDISTAKFVLGEPSIVGAGSAGAASSHAPVIPRLRWQRWLPLVAAATVTAFFVGAGAWALRPIRIAPVVAQFSIELPEGQSLSAGRQAVAISPDGTRIVYAANSRLYVRSIGELDFRAITGTENAAINASNPTFAPDGQSVAFVSQGDGGTQGNVVLKRIAIGGGTASIVGKIETTSGMSWGSDGILIGQTGGVLRVASSGGTQELIARVATDERAYGPQMLPGGRTVLFTVAKNVSLSPDFLDSWDKGQVVAISLDSGDRRVLIDGGSDGRYVPSGHLVYAVSGTMFAAPFDVQRLAITGPPVHIIAGVRRATGRTAPGMHLAISDTGTLVYMPGPATTSSATEILAIGDGRGEPILVKIPPGDYAHPRVSPDGTSFAVARSSGQDSDIWTDDLSGNAEIRRLTFGGTNRFPVWSGDGRRVTFQSAREGDRALFWQAADGTSGVERLTKPAQGEEHRPESWSRDGRHLLFSVVKDAKFSLWVLPIDSRKAEPFGGVQSAEPLSASFSPDGRWVVYASSVVAGAILSPNRGIFVQPFPATGQLHQAPQTFLDFHPVWAPDSAGIFYVPGATRPTVFVPVATRPSVVFGTPVSLPRGPRPGLVSGDVRGYDLLPDGRFLSLTQASRDGTVSAPSNEIRVVFNWFEELKRLAPTK